jgi:hypothetical protein
MSVSEHEREYFRKYYSDHEDEIVTYQKEYREKNKDRLREYDRQRYAKNREKVRARVKKYVENNHEKVLKNKRLYRLNHPDYYYENHDASLKKAKRYREKHRDRVLACLKKYRRERPEVALKHRDIRRKRTNSAICDLTKDDIVKIKSCGCLSCGAMDNLTIAHNVPVAKGGDTTKDNCFCLCRSCNGRMHTKTLDEWRPELLDKFNHRYD